MPFDPIKEKAERLERMRSAATLGRRAKGYSMGGRSSRRSGYEPERVQPSERALMIREGEKEAAKR